MLLGNRDSSVGIATRYGLDDLRFESRWGRDFADSIRLPFGPTQPHVRGIPSPFQGAKRPGLSVINPPPPPPGFHGQFWVEIHISL